MIAIDIGCARYGGDYSIERLIEEFKPHTLYGFDPSPAVTDDTYQIDDTLVIVRKAAAWTRDGKIGYHAAGLGGAVSPHGSAPRVACVNLAAFIQSLEPDEIVLKMDCEGSEYDLLPHLIDNDVDLLLTLAWIEWHKPDRGREQIEQRIRCPITEWRW